MKKEKNIARVLCAIAAVMLLAVACQPGDDGGKDNGRAPQEYNPKVAPKY